MLLRMRNQGYALASEGSYGPAADLMSNADYDACWDMKGGREGEDGVRLALRAGIFLNVCRRRLA